MSAADVLRNLGLGNGPSFKLPSLDGLLDRRVLQPRIQGHLREVYGLLGMSALAAAFGAHLAFARWLPAHPLMSLLAILPILYIRWTSASTAGIWRHAAVLCSAMLTGAGLAPLISYSLYVDPWLLVTALGGTALIFGVLTGVSLMARTRYALLLGGLLSTCTSVLFFGSLISLVYHSEFLENALLWVGLAVFSMWVVLDTQMIVERCLQYQAVLDVPMDALLLWSDLVQLFVRVLIILSRDRQRQDKRERRRQNYGHSSY